MNFHRKAEFQTLIRFYFAKGDIQWVCFLRARKKCESGSTPKLLTFIDS